jgi:hypothetical protein
MLRVQAIRSKQLRVLILENFITGQNYYYQHKLVKFTEAGLVTSKIMQGCASRLTAAAFRTFGSLSRRKSETSNSVWWLKSKQRGFSRYLDSESRSMSTETGGFQRRPGENVGEQKKGPPIDPKAKMGVAFTCTVCNTRVARFFSKISYERGVVIIKVTEEDGCTVNLWPLQPCTGPACTFFMSCTEWNFETRCFLTVFPFILCRAPQSIACTSWRTIVSGLYLFVHIFIDSLAS